MLSMSRFDDELKRVGLLADNADAKSILTIEVRDPGVNMVAGRRPDKQRASQPLTRMAADAVAGNSGSDVEGYRDYRGVNVVGAWTWLPEYDFGVATEMDVAEAYQPLRVLRYAFWTLIGLLALSALVILLFTVVIARQRAAVHEAVLAVKQLGQYTLEEKIGAGGMGSVYRARHAMLRRPTAIKLLDAEKMSELSVARFEREVQLTSQLNHPNTIAIFDFGHTPDGLFYYAMEYLDGIDLEDLVYRFGPLPEARVIYILRQICGSLAEAHALGLIHRDIKPANIILTNRGGMADFVKVLDFGLARAVEVEQDLRLTAANVISGTPQYMAPEAIDQPQSVDARTDLYAVGAVAYYLVTGKTVFDGNSVMEICMKQMKERPMLPSEALGRPISPWLEALILKCLGKTPRERPPSAVSLEAELAECKVDDTWTPADADKWWRRFKSEAGARPSQDSQAGQPTPQVGLETAPFGKAQ
jgi:hypothetical protein